MALAPGPTSGNVWGIRELASFDPDGLGPQAADLYVIGNFTHIGSQPSPGGLARWNGSSWSGVGGGLSHVLGPHAAALVVHDDGIGPLLYVGGYFTAAGPVVTSHLARWNGTMWFSLKPRLTTEGVYALADADEDGPGPRPRMLYAGGFMPSGPTGPGVYLTRWDGSAWEVLGGDFFGVQYLALSTVAAVESGPAAGLYAGGAFTSSGGVSAGRIARWGCPTPVVCYPDCTTDGQLTIADFACFQTRFVAADPYADCNAQGGLTIADFGCFQTRFVAGCP